jgi:arginine/lysine/histidine/glutamine transport system substrate-binding/permease protein
MHPITPITSCIARFCIAACLILLTVSGAIAQGSLEQIRSRGELVIATDPTYPPFEYKEKDQLIGFDIDLAAEIGKELGVKVRWIPMEWSGVLGALETHKVDAIMAGVTITEDRKKGNGFTRTYFLSGQSIARRKGDTRISGPKDLLDKTVAVLQETTGQFAVQKLGVPKDHIHRFDTQQDGLMDLRNGKSDASVGDEPAFREIIRKGYPELELIGKPFVRENLGIETRKADIDLIAGINRALDKIMVDGRYARIYEKWMLEPLTTATIGELDRTKNAGTPVPEELMRSAKGAERPSGEGQVTGSAFTIRWDLLRQALPQLLRGAQLTLWVTLLTLLIGAPAGLLIAILRLSSIALLKLIATVYVEVVRGTPLLMQIYVIYFVLPALHINFSPLLAAVTALSINAAAYISEIFRAGIESIDVGQMEAARSLGMDYRGAMRWIILPQTIRRVLPPLTNEAVALLKDSSLVSVVALSELMRVGKEIATTAGSPTTIYLGVAMLYLVMTLPLTWLVRRLESAWQPISSPRVRRK